MNNEKEWGIARSPIRSAKEVGVGGSEMRLARVTGAKSGVDVQEGGSKGVTMGDAETSAGGLVGKDMVRRRMVTVSRGGVGFICVVERTALGFCR